MSRKDELIIKGELLVAKATEGDVQAVSQLLVQDADVNYRTVKGQYTALVRACRMKRVEVAKILIDAGANVNAASQNGWTAMIEACRVGSSEMVKLLLSKNAHIDSVNRMGWTGLIEACRNVHFHIVKLAVEEGKADVLHIDKDGLMALDHTSAPILNIRNYLQKAMTEARKLLAEKEGISYEDWVRKHMPEEKLTREQDFAETCGRGDLDRVKRMLAEGVNINSVNKNGAYSALTLACRNQRIPVANYLLDQGADINQAAAMGWTPLIEAARVGNETLVETLIKKGAQINKTNAFGWPPLIEACRNGHYTVVSMLLEAGAEAGMEDGDGEVPMQHANQPWILALLRDRLTPRSPRSLILKFVLATNNMAPEQRAKALRELIEKVIREEEELRITAGQRLDELEQVNFDREMTQEEYQERTALLSQTTDPLGEIGKDSQTAALSTEFILFETLIQELSPELVATALEVPRIATAALHAKVNILHAMVQLPPPDDDDRKPVETTTLMQARASLVTKTMEAVIRALFGATGVRKSTAPSDPIRPATGKARKTPVDLKWFLSPATLPTSPLLQAASSYFITADKRLGEKMTPGLPLLCSYYFDLVKYLVEKGADINDMDANGNSLLHLLARPIVATSRMPDRTALNEVVHNYKAIWDLIVARKGPTSLKVDVVNARDATELGRPVLVYLAALPDHPDREELVVGLMERGACLPDADLFRAENQRLIGLLSGVMNRPDMSWRVMKSAVVYNDIGLVRKIVSRRMPVYMVNPNPRPTRAVLVKALGPANYKSAVSAMTRSATFGEGKLPGAEAKSPVTAPRDIETGETPASPPPRKQSKKNVTLAVDDDEDPAALQQERLLERKKRKEAKAAKAGASDDPEPEPIGDGIEGKVRRVEKTVEWVHPDVDLSSTDDCLLHMAIELEHKEIFHELLNYSESTPTQGEGGQWWPWPNRDVSGAITWRDRFGRNSFHVIAGKKAAVPSAANTEFFKRLLRKDQHALITQADHFGWAPLHHAAYHNKLDLVQELIRANIDLTRITEGTHPFDKQRAALHMCAMKGHWAVVLALLKTGIQADDIDIEGCTPLALAMLARQEYDASMKAQAEAAAAAANADNGGAVPALAAGAGAGAVHVPVKPRGSGGIELMTLPSTDGLDVPRISPARTDDEKLSQTRQREPSQMKSFHRKLVESYCEYQARENLNKSSTKSSATKTKSGPVTAPANQMELFTMAISALLENNASIAVASESSGKSLNDLMNVEEKWLSLSRTIESLRNEEGARMKKYFEDILKPDYDLKQRRLFKADMELDLKVLETRRGEVFLDKENQMVIDQYYDEEIRRRLVIKLCRYLCFLILITVLGIYASTRDTSSAYWLRTLLQNSLVDQVFDPSVSPIPKTFGTIDSSKDDMYQFLLGAFIPRLYTGFNATVASNLGSGALSTTVPLPGNSFADGHNVIVGVPRLRQIRHKPMSCDVDSALLSDRTDRKNLVCLDSSGEDTRPFGARVYPVGSTDPYFYNTEDDLKGAPIWGRVYSLSGAGYVQEFPSLADADGELKARNMVQNLSDANWIDYGTKAVFLEMTLFNANENHFCQVSLLLEFPLAGGIVASADLFVAKLHRTVGYPDTEVRVLGIIVFILVIMHTYSEVMQMRESRNCAYFRSLYNWTDIIIMVFSPTILALVLAQILQEGDVDWDSTQTFVPTQRLARLVYIQNILFSILILTAWAKLFDYLSVFKNLYRLIIIIETMAAKLAEVLIVFCLVLAAFTSAEYVAYGYLDVNTKTWFWGFINRFIGVFGGGAVMYDHQWVARILGTFYTIIFLLIFSMLLLNIIVAMLTSGYDEAINQSSDVMAQRQYDKMHGEGIVRKIEERAAKTRLEQKQKGIYQEEDEDATGVGMVFGAVGNVVGNVLGGVDDAAEAMAGCTESLDNKMLSCGSRVVTWIDDAWDRLVVRNIRSRNIAKRSGQVVRYNPIATAEAAAASKVTTASDAMFGTCKVKIASLNAAMLANAAVDLAASGATSFTAAKLGNLAVQRNSTIARQQQLQEQDPRTGNDAR